MIYISIILFALAAVFGTLLLTYVIKGRETPKSIVFTHGPLAAIALILLIIYTVNSGENLWLPVVLFALAAIGGVFMLYRDLTGRKIPGFVAIVHGLIAVAAFSILLAHVI